MPWYKAGTVSVAQNSNAVAGTSTSFIANSRVGDAFRGPDGGWYEVTNIASDTAMSISPNYQGSSNSAGTYALAPMQGYVKDSADALRALVNQFGSTLAVLGQSGTLAGVRTALNLTDTAGLPEGTNKYYTDARVRGAALTGLVTTDGTAVAATDAVVAAFGKLQAQATAASNSIAAKAAKGANSDITSLSGLTTALSAAQGGTGVTSVAALVTLLLSAGIIESGTLNSGYYTKYADGTLIQRRSVTIGGGTVANGSVFKSLTYDMGAMPVAFVGEYQVVPYGISQNSGGGWAGQQQFGSQSAWGSWSAYTAAAATGNMTIALLGIGRWKA